MITLIILLVWAIIGLAFGATILYMANEIVHDDDHRGAREEAERVLEEGVLTVCLLSIAFWPFVLGYWVKMLISDEIS